MNKNVFRNVFPHALSVLLIVLTITVFAGKENCFAQTTAIFNFDDKILYDIYIGGENAAVIRSVNILRQTEINGKAFIIIKPSGFSVTEHQGYISFDAIQAVLPAIIYRVDATKGFNFIQR